MTSKKELKRRLEYADSHRGYLSEKLSASTAKHEERVLELEYRWLYGQPATDKDRDVHRLRRLMHGIMHDEMDLKFEAQLLCGTSDTDIIARESQEGRLMGTGGNYSI